MGSINIQAKELPLYKVFSNDFVFKIPLYQRPYAWTTEEAEALLEDLVTAVDDANLLTEANGNNGFLVKKKEKNIYIAWVT